MGSGKSSTPPKKEPVITENNNNVPDEPQLRGVPRADPMPASQSLLSTDTRRRPKSTNLIS